MGTLAFFITLYRGLAGSNNGSVYRGWLYRLRMQKPFSPKESEEVADRRSARAGAQMTGRASNEPRIKPDLRWERKVDRVSKQLNAAKRLEIFRLTNTRPGVEGDVERFAAGSLLRLAQGASSLGNLNRQTSSAKQFLEDFQ